MKDFLRRKRESLVGVLLGDPAAAREELRRRISKLVLTPKETPSGPMFEVTGDVELFAGGEDVMLAKTLEGIGQHYTLPRIDLAGAVIDPSLPLAA